MSAPTREDLKQRIRDYMATYTNIGTDVTDADEPITSYPAFEVEFYGTTRELSGRRCINTYTVRVYMYGCEARDITDDQKWRADRATTEAFIDPLADFIAANPMWKHPVTVASSMTSESSPPSDAGVGLVNINKKAYAGFALEFTTTMGR